MCTGGGGVFSGFLSAWCTYICLMNTISQERFEGFSLNFAQIFTLTQGLADYILEVIV